MLIADSTWVFFFFLNRETRHWREKNNASKAIVIFFFSFQGDPRRPYPTDLEMRSGLLGQMNNPSTNGVNGHLPGDALAAGRLPGKEKKASLILLSEQTLLSSGKSELK